MISDALPALLKVLILLVGAVVLYYWLTRQERKNPRLKKAYSLFASPLPRNLPPSHVEENMRLTFYLVLINYFWKLLGLVFLGGLLLLYAWLKFGR